jgi:hypothetical protein
VTLERRATFARVADVLLPATDGLPAPSSLEVEQRLLDRALVTRPDLAAELDGVLDALDGADLASALPRLHDEQPARFAVLALFVTGAYYLSPKVRRAIGYPGQKADPALVDEADWFLRDGILEDVVARGPIWRPA